MQVKRAEAGGEKGLRDWGFTLIAGRYLPGVAAVGPSEGPVRPLTAPCGVLCEAWGRCLACVVREGRAGLPREAHPLGARGRGGGPWGGAGTGPPRPCWHRRMPWQTRQTALLQAAAPQRLQGQGLLSGPLQKI